MAENSRGAGVTTSQLIVGPAVLTFGLVLLRLVGDLKRWPMPWFNSAQGGAGALIGIVWLPFIFGPYFAFRVRFQIVSPSNMKKWVAYPVIGSAVSTAGVLAGHATGLPAFARLLLPVLGFALGAGIQYLAWPAFIKVLLAYGYAARIPVVAVALLAMRHNWASHYNAYPSYLPAMSFWPKFFLTVVLPQLVGWVGYTVVGGSLTAALASALLRERSSELARQ